MKKQILSFLLAGLLLFGCVTATAQTQPYLQVLGATMNENTLTLTLRLGTPETVTLLVYGCTPTGGKGDLLYVTQRTVSLSGVITQEFMIEPSCEYGYLIQVGGSRIDTPKEFTLTTSYVCEAWRILENDTPETLVNGSYPIENLQVVRGEQVVTPTDLVLPGDQVQGTFLGEDYTAWAVIPGDVDLNSKVNAVDALQILRHTVGKTTLTQASFAAANWEQDGKIDATDALKLLRFIVGKVNNL